MQQMPRQAIQENYQESPKVSSSKNVLIDHKDWIYVQNRYRLTPRERQIAELICQGLKNNGIARNLRIRPGTVKTHLRNIYRKVRVESKIAMLLQFVEEARNHSDHS